MLKYLISLTLVLATMSLSAQTIRCSTDERAPTAYDNYDKFLKEYDQSLLAFNNASNNYLSSPSTFTIPVHIIIVHSPGEAIGTGDNFSMEHIQSQIEVLNEDFRRLNADAVNTPSQFAAGDSEIEFCLAVVDENGNTSDGVTRYPTNQNMEDDENAIKAATGWDRDDYLNIWSAPDLGSLLGWAYLPSTTSLPNATLDGVVCASGSFGGPGFATYSPYNLGRTTTHEVGHYLGLQHIWRNNGCGADDGFDDTPLQNGSNYGCPSHPSPSCSNNGDMFMNYMDYVNDDCMNAFTVDQGAYMRSILNTSRSSLAASSTTVCNLTAPLVLTLVNSTNIDCFSESTGSIEVIATDGVSPYVYAINNGAEQGSGLFQNLPAGTYLVTVTDDAGSTESLTIEISQSDALFATIVAENDNLCHGEFTGSIVINISGGALPYYVNGQIVDGTQHIIDNLPAGSYVANISDLYQCTMILPYDIEEPQPIAISIDQQSDVLCFGQSSGSFGYTILGGTPDYTVELNGSILNSNAVTNLPAGTYNLEVQDQHNCYSSLDIEIDQPDALSANIIVDQQESCFNQSDGIATITTQGGTSPFNFYVDDKPVTQQETFENLEAGEHEVNIIDANGCSTNTNFTIEAGFEIEIVIIEQENAACGQPDGLVSMQANLGEFPYNYHVIELNETNTTGVFENLSGGQYTIEVTDDHGCLSTSMFSILENDAATLQLIDSNDLICFDSMDGFVVLQLDEIEGVEMYSIDGINYQESGTFDQLEAGTYSFYATDDSGCVAQMNVTIESNPIINFEIETIDPLCFGASNGSVLIEASGGSGVEYSYSLGSDPNQSNTDGQFLDLVAGPDSILIMDAMGCTQMAYFELTVQGILIVDISETNNTSCFGTATGSASFSTSNSQGNISYTVIDFDGNEADADALFAGSYIVISTDENGCTAQNSFDILDESPIEWEIINQTDANCDGSIRGTANFQALSGQSPYIYSVGQNSNSTGEFDNFNAGTYELTIEDATGCVRIVNFTIGQLDAYAYGVTGIMHVSCFGETDGSIQIIAEGPLAYSYRLNGSENQSGFFENLPAGIYPFEIEDVENCIVYDTVIIVEPDLLELQIMDETVNQNGLTDITLSASGGTQPYKYQLAEGPFQDSPEFTDLANGSYSFIVTDSNGCTTTLDQLISELSNEQWSDLRLYPNPFSSSILLELTLKSSVDLAIHVVTVEGKSIKHIAQKTYNAGDQKIRLELDDIPAGLYMLQIQSGQATTYYKIIKK